MGKGRDKIIKFYLALIIAILGFVLIMRIALTHGMNYHIEYYAPNLKLARIFTDNMVLQSNQEITLWGSAYKGKEVIVEFDKKKYQVKSNDHNKWQVKIPKHKAGGPYQIKIHSDKEEILLSNVMVGDLWLILGESLASMPLSNLENFVDEIKFSQSNPQIRYLDASLLIEEAGSNEFARDSKWQIAKPESVTKFAALPYYFAKSNYLKYHLPIGVIKLAEDFVPIETFISKDVLREFPPYEDLIKETKAKNYKAKLEHRYQALFDTDLKLSGTFQIKLNKRKEGDISLFVNGRYIGKTLEGHGELRSYNISPEYLKPKYNSIELRVTDIDNEVQLNRDHLNMEVLLIGGGGTDTVIGLHHDWHEEKTQDLGGLSFIYDKVINDLRYLKFKGVVLYQGESDLSNTLFYEKLLAALINDWRIKLGSKQLPFILLQTRNNINMNSSAESIAKIMAAQINVGNDLQNVYIVDTADLGLKASAASIAELAATIQSSSR